MAGGYGSHADYINWVKGDADARQEKIQGALAKAFLKFIEKREVEVIVFSNMSAFDLAKAILAQPVVLKPLLAACNVAGRAVERDLAIKNLDTYSPSLNEDHAKVIAGYIKPFLPPYLEIPALSQIDKLAFIDKEIRRKKGRWEKRILENLNRFGLREFRKRIFQAGGENFELDAANPRSGDIRIGVDIKRIEARRDIHKRCDEIVNKAAKLKCSFPGAKFGAVVYYPFIDEHVNIQNRLHSDAVDCVVFASDSAQSIENAVRILLSTLEIAKK